MTTLLTSPEVRTITYYHHGRVVSRRDAESRLYAYQTVYGDDNGELQTLWNEAHFDTEDGEYARQYLLEALDLEIDLVEEC